MSLPESPAAKHEVVAGEFSRLVEQTTDWSAPAPVDGWTARDVVDHLVSWFTGFLAAGGVDTTAIRFATAFGRTLDYYSGMVFELHAKKKSRAREQAPGPLAAGGRYDRLLTLLGSANPVPAVGFAVWIERLEQAGGRP